MILLKMHLDIRWVLPGLAVIMLTAIFMLSSSDVNFVPVVSPAPYVMTNPTQSGFLINTPGCQIPLMEAFDPTIKKYLRRASDYVCNALPPLIESNQTSIWISTEVLQMMNITQKDIQCCFQAIWRKHANDVKKGQRTDNSIVGVVKCHEFEESTNIFNEFIRVRCNLNGSEIYRDFHGFVVPKKNEADTDLQNVPTDMKPSVLIIGLDAVSRLNFYRQMPKTVTLLKSLEAIELLGYNKVDDNTFPNLIPVLTGQSVEDIKKTCWKNKNAVFDDCPFLWKNYYSKGYRTAFGEDACWMGIFQYLKRGFFKQPVDYYLHTLMWISEREIGHHKDMNAEMCAGSRLTANVLFDHAEKLAVNLTQSNKPFFGFFWGSSLTHDYLNVPPQTDNLYESLIRNLHDKGVLNSTIVLVMSDHGIRWGPIRETYQGRVEERLPLVHFLFPEWFKVKYSWAVANLYRNRKMLTSPFDIYETLIDLSDLKSLSKPSLIQRSNSRHPQRGMSLFVPVPEQRTCEDAGIPENWCTCHESRNVSIQDPMVAKAAQAVVDYLNKKLFQYIQCSQLSLNEIKSAMLASPNKVVKSSTPRSIQDWTVVLVTTPGMAEFESIVRQRLGKKEELEVLGYVSRINTYGNQSRCIDDFQMRLYCYCP